MVVFEKIIIKRNIVIMLKTNLFIATATRVIMLRSTTSYAIVKQLVSYWHRRPFSQLFQLHFLNIMDRAECFSFFMMSVEVIPYSKPFAVYNLQTMENSINSFE